MSNNKIRQATIQTLVDHCRQESKTRRKGEVGFCLELFRRAVDESTSDAWSALDLQYRHLVCKWVLDLKKSQLDESEVNQFASEVLEKFWRALSKKQRPIETNFPHVGAVLSYLKQTVLTVILEKDRARKKQQRVHEALSKQYANESSEPTYTIDDASVDDRIELVRSWVDASISDPLEQLVYKLSFEYELPPRKISALHPDKFASAEDVYKIKIRLLKRAKRHLSKSVKKD